MTSPLRGPRSKEGGGFAAAHLRARRACYGGRPSGLQDAAHRASARQPCGLPWTPETTAAPAARKSGRPRPAPALRAARKPPQWRTCARTRTRGKQMNSRPVLTKRKISGIAAGP